MHLPRNSIICRSRARIIWWAWGLITTVNTWVALISRMLEAHSTDEVATEDRSIWEPGRMHWWQMCRGKALAETQASPVASQSEYLGFRHTSYLRLWLFTLGSSSCFLHLVHFLSLFMLGCLEVFLVKGIWKV